MARYVTLLRFTEQGSRAIKKSAARAASFRNAAQKDGVSIEAQLWTTGSRDGLLILRGDEKKILRCLGRLVSQGNVRSESFRAFDAQEFKDLMR